MVAKEDQLRDGRYRVHHDHGIGTPSIRPTDIVHPTELIPQKRFVPPERFFT